MRTHLFSVVASVFLAATLLAATASTALMAPVTNPVCDSQNATFSYTYDDSTLQVTGTTITNTSLTPWTLTVTWTNPTTGAVLYSVNASFNIGTKQANIRSLNIFGTMIVNWKGQTVFNPPFDQVCSWSPT